MGAVTHQQKLRYGFAAGLIIVGFVCAAVSTGTIGGALATVCVAGGLLLFLVFLFRDLGLTVDGSTRRRTSVASGPQAPRAPAPHPEGSHPEGSHPETPLPEAPRPADGGRPRAATRRPARLRGDRRRPS